jgi:hypothetical protein
MKSLHESCFPGGPELLPCESGAFSRSLDGCQRGCSLFAQAITELQKMWMPVGRNALKAIVKLNRKDTTWEMLFKGCGDASSIISHAAFKMSVTAMIFGNCTCT